MSVSSHQQNYIEHLGAQLKEDKPIAWALHIITKHPTDNRIIIRICVVVSYEMRTSKKNHIMITITGGQNRVCNERTDFIKKIMTYINNIINILFDIMWKTSHSSKTVWDELGRGLRWIKCFSLKVVVPDGLTDGTQSGTALRFRRVSQTTFTFRKYVCKFSERLGWVDSKHIFRKPDLEIC